MERDPPKQSKNVSSRPAEGRVRAHCTSAGGASWVGPAEPLAGARQGGRQFGLRRLDAAFLPCQQVLMNDWPHGPPHRLAEQGAYMITAGTYGKAHLFDQAGKLDMFRRLFFDGLTEAGCVASGSSCATRRRWLPSPRAWRASMRTTCSTRRTQAKPRPQRSASSPVLTPERHVLQACF